MHLGLVFGSIATVRNMSNSEWNDPEANVLPEKMSKTQANGESNGHRERRKIVVVGLGMVGIAFVYVNLKLNPTGSWRR